VVLLISRVRLVGLGCSWILGPNRVVLCWSWWVTGAGAGVAEFFEASRLNQGKTAGVLGSRCEWEWVGFGVR
jgi:hypothetical protein